MTVGNIGDTPIFRLCFFSFCSSFVSETSEWDMEQWKHEEEEGKGRSESQSSQLPASSGQRGGDTPKQIGGQQEEDEYRGEIESRLKPQLPNIENKKKDSTITYVCTRFIALISETLIK